ncbi:MAG: DNA repair protein RecO [Clostridiales Family XIII bacterium]|jgi:DNA repair protein RecO (recombination protein O)|nr:DNA repair protein RecO [Clostridiales Family XIII bacterium]
MYTETEGIVFRQIKSIRGRQIIVLLTERYGKISAGTSIPGKGKNRTSLAIRPFTYGRYEINKLRELYHLNRAETVNSHYKIGEDVDKYLHASHALEFTEKLLPEGAPAPRILALIAEYFKIMERSGGDCATLTLAYQIKALKIWGVRPRLDSCARCGGREGLSFFSAGEGGVVCQNCVTVLKENGDEALLYGPNFDIINIMSYFLDHPLGGFARLSLDGRILKALRQVVKEYAAYHMDIGTLNSDIFFTE